MRPLFIIILLLVKINLFAQLVPVKFGKIDPREVAKMSYNIDKNADAIVLCHYGYFSLDDYEFRDVIRIKILTEEGKKWTEKSFSAHRNATIRGITYNIENGKLVKSRLSPDQIYRTEVTVNTHWFDFKMPDVRIGSVVDIQVLNRGLAQEWRFQEEIPVLHSELQIPYSSSVDYRKSYHGEHPLLINKSGRWVAESVPALEDGPFLTSINNYFTRLELDLLRYEIPGFVIETFTQDWDDVRQTLDGHSNFGGFKILTESTRGYFNKIINDAKDKSLDEKIRIAMREARRMEWNGWHSLYTSSVTLHTPWHKKEGNSADINLTLWKLLKKMDVNTSPVAISTRSNGFLYQDSPTLSKLCSVVVLVRDGDKNIFLDATDPYLPVGSLSEECLNYRGLVVDRAGGYLINIDSDRSQKELSYFELKVESESQLSGVLTQKKSGYAGSKFRKDLKELSSTEKMRNDINDLYPNLMIETLEIEKSDSEDKPVKIKSNVKVKMEKDEETGNYLYYPIIIDRLIENPFQTDTRHYPVEYSMEDLNQTIVKLELPENCEIISMPENTNLGFPDKSAEINYQTALDGNMLTIKFEFNLNKPQFESNEFTGLKALYDSAVELGATPIQLRFN